MKRCVSFGGLGRYVDRNFGRKKGSEGASDGCKSRRKKITGKSSHIVGHKLKTEGYFCEDSSCRWEKRDCIKMQFLHLS